MWSKLGNFRTKSSQNVELFSLNSPNSKKYRPNGDQSGHTGWKSLDKQETLFNILKGGIN
jgi:hypothetical protein